MFLNMPLITDWPAIARTCEHHVNENLQCANRKRRQFDYAPGKTVLKKVHDPTKLGVRTEGPCTIERVHVNGNWLYYCVKGLLSASTYAEFCHIIEPFHIPL
jgi:hypothetical protein